MPKAFRECSFCTNNSHVNLGVLFFTVTDHIKTVLNFAPPNISYICEQHFDLYDVKTHGPSKRLRDGAVPVHFPRQVSMSKDHDYEAAPLDLDLVNMLRFQFSIEIISSSCYPFYIIIC